MAPNPALLTESPAQQKILWVSADPRSCVGDLLGGMEAIGADSVSSGLECYEAVRSGSYCAIVAEFPLPDCSADELLEEVQRLDSSLPVLIRDTVCRISDVVRLTKAGAHHVFGAELDPDEFTQQIEAAQELRALRSVPASAPCPPGENSWWGTAPLWNTYSALSAWSGSDDAPY